MAGCVRCRSARADTTNCSTLPAHSYSPTDENFKATQHAEKIAAEEMKHAFDTHKGEDFERICDEHDRHTINQGNAARKFPINGDAPSLRAQYIGLTALFAGAFSTEEPDTLSAGLEVLDPPQQPAITEQKTDVRREHAAARDVGAFVVHAADLMRDRYDKPVLDMLIENATFNCIKITTDARHPHARRGRGHPGWFLTRQSTDAVVIIFM
ncbi:hypothetical protein CYMTET_49733 [Cymbomonas tetramitiformis]|uniref:Uncharacterized protein n=1 Tax=Cymbomonas tetramitiformis TaxID=36881 RepID=A0AAE0EU92_9CHLO|nr:hypothetical protein CYMTET_49733 [Cymbomonas tetramitiformis]